MARKIPWLRVSVEGAVIVISILLAFGIDALWDEVQERRQEQEALAALQAEFEGHVADLEAYVPTLSRITRGIEFLFTVGGQPASELPVATVDSAFRAALSAPTLDPGKGTLDALSTSGRIRLIEAIELQEALTAWTGQLAEMREGQLLMRDFVVATLVPYLAEEGVPLTRAYGVISPDRPTSLMSSEAAALEYARVLSDTRFRSLLSLRLGGARATEVDQERAIRMARRTLALIGEAIDE